MNFASHFMSYLNLIQVIFQITLKVSFEMQIEFTVDLEVFLLIHCSYTFRTNITT